MDALQGARACWPTCVFGTVAKQATIAAAWSVEPAAAQRRLFFSVAHSQRHEMHHRASPSILVV